MAGSITSVNATFILTVPNVYPVPQLLENFSVDDIYDYDDVETVQTAMSVDGRLAGGLVLNEVRQRIHLMANSSSADIFDGWNNAMKLINDVYIATAQVTLTSIRKKAVCTGGFLTRYKPFPDAKKVLQSRSFEITWERVLIQNASAAAF